MWFPNPNTQNRGLSKAVANLILVIIVVIGAMIIGFVVLNLGQEVNEPRPETGFTADINGTNITLEQTVGEEIQRSQLQVENGYIIQSPETIQTGDQITIMWTDTNNSVILWWESQDTSYVLYQQETENHSDNL